MKSLASYVLIFVSSFGIAQSGTDCTNAILITSNQTCIYQTFTSSTSSMWFKFVANSENVNISLQTEKFGLDVPHIHNISLYEGTCSSLNLKTEDELPFEDNAEKLAIDLNASGLTPGNIYFLKADREAHIGECDKLTCKSNQSSSSAIFNLCVEEIDVFIPLDFGFEEPITKHAYEQNRGQLTDIFTGDIVTDIKMFSRLSYPKVFIAEDYASFVWSKIDTIESTIDTIQRVDMALVNSNQARVFKTEELPAFNNYYLPHVPRGILKNKSYSRVVCNDIYPGIDLQYYSNEKGVKMYFILNEGSNSDDIILQFEGANSVHVTTAGGINISTELGDMAFKRATVYRINPSGNIVPMPVSGDFVDLGNNKFTVNVQNYSFNMPVVIQIERDRELEEKSAKQPTWSTYFGGSGNEWGYEIDSDDLGNVYTVGATTSDFMSFPFAGTGIFQSDIYAASDGWLTKFNDNYIQEWTTYIGGDGEDAAVGVAHDGTTNSTYISMSITSSNSSLTSSLLNFDPQSFVDNGDPGWYAYAARFNDQGAREWATRLPGYQYIGTHYPSKIAVDSQGNVIVAGTMHTGTNGINSCLPDGSGALPICGPLGANSFQQSNYGSGSNIFDEHLSDMYIVKLTPSLHPFWSTIIGGNRDEIFYNLAVDQQNDNIYIVGSTQSDNTNENCPSTVNAPAGNGDFPLCEVSGGYYQNSLSSANEWDGFVMRFNGLGELNWSTYIGGVGEDAVTGIDVNGAVVISGFTETSYYGNNPCATPSNGGFPTCDNNGLAYTQPYSGGTTQGDFDAFVMKFRNSSHLLEWSTYLGGAWEEAHGQVDLGAVNTSDFCTGPKVHIGKDSDILVFGNTQSGSLNGTWGHFPTQDNNSYYYQSVHSENPSGDLRQDNFVTMFNTSGTKKWSTYFGGDSPDLTGDRAGGITTYGDKIYICGTTQSTGDFPYKCPLGMGGAPFCESVIGGSQDAYIAQLVRDGVDNVGLNDLMHPEEVGLGLYPNPSTGSVTISLNGNNLEGFSIIVYNQLGQQVYFKEHKANLENEALTLDLSFLANGIYVFSVSDGKALFSNKLIINSK